MAQPGQTIGPYVIDSVLAEGGMGVVYAARNRVTGQRRALKIVKDDLAKKPDFVDRFVREASIASQVRHAHLVETLEPGIDGDVIYLPMELLEGETLHARLRRAKRLDPGEAAAILGPVCLAVQALHDRGLVHRDLKPMNVFLHRTAQGEVPKVLDFGTARELEDDEHTKTGMVVGSPYYMAPEQAEGRRDIDGRADQYAVGVMAYQMMTGLRPYESDDTRSALAKLLRGEPYVPPRRAFAGVSEAMEHVIVRALAREREHRYPRIAELGAALAAAASAPALMAANAGPFVPTQILPVPPDPASGVSGVRQATGPFAVEPAAANVATSSAGFVATPAPAAPPAPGRSVLPFAIGALAVLGLVAGGVAWVVIPSPEVRATELAPRMTVVPLPSPTPPPVTPAMPTSIPAPAPMAPPSDVVPALAPPAAAVPAAGEPAGTSPERPTEPAAETSPREPRTPREGRPDRRGASAGRPPEPEENADDTPCGAATGIPCLD